MRFTRVIYPVATFMQDGPKATFSVQHVEVSADQAGQRIDNFLLRLAAGVPRSHVYRIIRKGEVRVNGGRVRPTRKLAVGDVVRVPPLALKTRETVTVPDAVADRVGRSVVMETPDFLLINKPPGLAVHGGSGLAFGLIDALRQVLDEPGLELVHRLDRGTSGCLLVARGGAVGRELQNLFRDRSITKIYMAIVDGVWSQESQTVTAKLESNKSHAGERRVMVSDSGQHAVSHFKRLQAFDEASLMQVHIETGRTHQIRVHASHAGHPVVGDTRYGRNNRNAQFKRLGLDRLYLHSCSLAFDWREERVNLQAPVGSDWQLAQKTLCDA